MHTNINWEIGFWLRFSTLRAPYRHQHYFGNFFLFLFLPSALFTCADFRRSTQLLGIWQFYSCLAVAVICFCYTFFCVCVYIFFVHFHLISTSFLSWICIIAWIVRLTNHVRTFERENNNTTEEEQQQQNTAHSIWFFIPFHAKTYTLWKWFLFDWLWL